jgi:hypothetical protein
MVSVTDFDLRDLKFLVQDNGSTVKVLKALQTEVGFLNFKNRFNRLDPKLRDALKEDLADLVLPNHQYASLSFLTKKYKEVKERSINECANEDPLKQCKPLPEEFEKRETDVKALLERVSKLENRISDLDVSNSEVDALKEELVTLKTEAKDSLKRRILSVMAWRVKTKRDRLISAANALVEESPERKKIVAELKSLRPLYRFLMEEHYVQLQLAVIQHQLFESNVFLSRIVHLMRAHPRLKPFLMGVKLSESYPSLLGAFRALSNRIH